MREGELQVDPWNVSVGGARRRSALARRCRAPTGSDQSFEDCSNGGVYSNRGDI